MDLQTQEKVLFEHDFLGIALSRVPPGYEGPCVVQLEGRTNSAVAFLDVGNANSAARFAVGELGGYSKAVVSRAPGADYGYAHWTDWAFGH